MEYMTADRNDTSGIKWWLGDLREDDLLKGVKVWQFSISAHHQDLPVFQQYLSEDEKERAGRFHFSKDQVRFIIVRGILRSILGKCIGMRPHELRFRYSSYGKPEIASGDTTGALHFNLSHSGDLAIIAVSRGSVVGVDIEQKRPGVDIDIVSSRFFSQQEIQLLNSIDPAKRDDIFYTYWARKEAFIKALGKGVSFPLEHCDVSLLNSDRSLPVTVAEKGSGWYGIDLPTEAGYAAALVTEGEGGVINFSQF
jgi:4'-phosphopantetheinyl transferase